MIIEGPDGGADIVLDGFGRCGPATRVLRALRKKGAFSAASNARPSEDRPWHRLLLQVTTGGDFFISLVGIRAIGLQ